MDKIKTVIEASYLPTRDAATLLNKEYGWQLDPELSRMDTKVFFDPQTNQAQILHRGSKRVVDDWLKTNLPLAFGSKDTERFKYAKDISQKAQEKYGNVHQWGHSLGGGLALANESKNGVTAVNPAIALPDIGKRYMESTEIVKKSLDPVSILSDLTFGGKRTTQASQSINPIAEHSYEAFY